MNTSKEEAKILRSAIDQWQRDGLLDSETAGKLGASIHITTGSRRQLAQYFLIIAISCSLLAFGAIFLDSKLLETLRKTFALSAWTIAAISGGLAAVWFWYIRKKLAPGNDMVREFYLVLGALAALTSLVYVCKETGAGEAYSGGLLAATLLMGFLAVLFQSTALWIAAMGAFGGWAGAATYIWSHEGLFLGMNIPLRFVFIGALLFGLAYVFRRFRSTTFAFFPTRLVGLVTVLLSLWAASIFGNHTHLSTWVDVRQTGMIPYALLFAVVAGFALVWGIRQDDAALRDAGLIALLINGYTRYFEYFWDGMNKGLFFLLLAVSFFVLGRWLASGKSRSPFFRKRAVADV